MEGVGRGGCARLGCSVCGDCWVGRLWDVALAEAGAADGSPIIRALGAEPGRGLHPVGSGDTAAVGDGGLRWRTV